MVAGQRPRMGPWTPGRVRADADATVLPLYIDPMTKLFLVALMWCRPWLLDPGGHRPLPRTPEIARAALEVTGAYHELERFDTDPAFRDRLSARVAEHIKVLRRKITERGLVRADVRLSDEVVVRLLIEHGIDHRRRPGPAQRPGLVLPAGGPVVDDPGALTFPARRSSPRRGSGSAGCGPPPGWPPPGGGPWMTWNLAAARWPSGPVTMTRYQPSGIWPVKNTGS